MVVVTVLRKPIPRVVLRLMCVLCVMMMCVVSFFISYTLHQPLSKFYHFTFVTSTTKLKTVRPIKSTISTGQNKQGHSENLFRGGYNQTAANLTRNRLRGYLSLNTTLHAYIKGGNRKDNFYNMTKAYDAMLCNCEEDHTFGIESRRFRTCAVVGNGGVLLNSQCGEEIDSHDLVLRLNMATIKNFENDVGVKTTIMTVNAAGLRTLVKSLAISKNKTNEQIIDQLRFLNDSILWHFKRLDSTQRLLQTLHDSMTETLHGGGPHLAISLQNIVSPTRKAWKIGRPTTGLVGYTFAAAICDQVSLYGFYPFYRDEDNDPIYNHYYETDAFNFTTDTKHTYNKEFEILKRQNNTGAIRLITRKCKRHL